MRPFLILLSLALASTGALAEAPVEAPVPVEGPVEQAPSIDEPVETEAAPEEAPKPEAAKGEEAEPAAVADHEVDEPAEPIVVAPSDAGPAELEPTACIAALRAMRVDFEQIDPIKGEGPCGAAAPVRVTSVNGIELAPPVALRCPAAEALALWVDRVVAPLADLYMDRSLDAVLTSTGYQCRKRRGATTSKWSEHSFANAIDIAGVRFDDGETLAIAERDGSSEPARAYQAGIRGGACAFFTTVLGPSSNAAHADHLHLDMAERKGGYRLCE